MLQCNTFQELSTWGNDAGDGEHSIETQNREICPCHVWLKTHFFSFVEILMKMLLLLNCLVYVLYPSGRLAYEFNVKFR